MIPFFKLVPVAMVDFRRMLGWLGEVCHLMEPKTAVGWWRRGFKCF